MKKPLIENVHFKSKQTKETESLEKWREFFSVSAYQAQAALTIAGFMPRIQEILEAPETDPLTVLAWNKAQELRRNSVTVLEFADLLDISPLELDDLFKFAKTIEV